VRKVKLAAHFQGMQDTIQHRAVDVYTENCCWVATYSGRRLKVMKRLLKLEVTVAGSGAWRADVEQNRGHDRLQH
jgi:hypothetical protein